jgi:hypothetical protein
VSQRRVAKTSSTSLSVPNQLDGYIMDANGRTLSPEAIQSIERRREWNAAAAMLAGAPAPPQIVGLWAEQSSAQANLTTKTQETTTNTEVRGVSHLRVCYQLMK